ncbi:type II secretion system protein N [Marinobacter sp. F3R08]|uniref:type II secretion system protein N n=1 Tax=Marinobacter sp. F3R08 TaxID=2841559 RepID=UPI001C0833A4|nr:type II secretion system protein N [Marinobacter sp. F3R08]MBU2955980.1 general secretion pathway protein GspC [Marinobacter sp. F3R08]
MLLNNERLPLILALVAGAAMVTLTAYQGYRFWEVESRNPEFDSMPPLISDPTTGRQTPKVTLASLDLFGAASKEAPPTEPDTENLPETNLRLFLRGVLAADGEFPGSALIEDDKSKTEAYLVGDELPGNATLRSVHPHRVIIERSGKLENLYFPELKDRSGISFTANQQTEPTPPPQQITPASPSKAPASTSDEQRREEIRRRLEQLRERLRNNN